jgi:hypothetical protein
MKKGNMLDQYMNDSIGVTDLSWIGTTNTEEESSYLCSDCNVSLIKKLDDTKHLGLAYDRYICPSCLAITDQLKEEDIANVKHAETIHTLTDSNTNTTEPFAECLGAKSDDLLEESDDPLESQYDSDEAQELRNQEQIISSVRTVIRSSVTGKIIERFEE